MSRLALQVLALDMRTQFGSMPVLSTCRLPVRRSRLNTFLEMMLQCLTLMSRFPPEISTSAPVAAFRVLLLCVALPQSLKVHPKSRYLKLDWGGQDRWGILFTLGQVFRITLLVCEHRRYFLRWWETSHPADHGQNCLRSLQRSLQPVVQVAAKLRHH